MRWLIRAVFVTSVTLVIVFLVLALGVRLVVVPNIGSFRNDITAHIAKGVGRDVAIAEIEAGWDGWSPTLSLVDFTMFDSAGRAALKLPRVETSVSWRSVLLGEVRLRRFDVTGAQLLVRRDAQGRIHVGGIDVEQRTDDDDSAAADWFIKQRLVAFRQGTLVWQDEFRKAPALRLENVNLLLENRGDHHRFGLTATPPAGVAAPLDVRGEITLSSINDMPKAPGRIYTRLDWADVGAWKPWLPPLPFELRSGRGAIRGWAAFAGGEVTDVTVDLVLDDVRARFRPQLPELDLAHLAGRMTWRQQAEISDFTTRNLELTQKNGVRLTPGDITIKHIAKVGDKAAQGEIKSSRLHLDPVFALVQYLPVDDRLRAKLAKFGPVGTLDSGTYAWTGPLDAPLDYDLRAQFRGVSVNAVDTMPGMTRMTGSVEANGRGGSMTVNADGSRLTLPNVFAAPVDFEQFALQASWKIADRVTVRIGKFAFANADAAGTAQGEYRTLDKGPGHIDMTGSLSRGKGPSAHKYMPVAVAPHVRNWLRGAIVAGNATDVKFVVKGNLFDFPFAGQQGGLFRLTAKATDGVVDYADRWPAITGIKADLLFEGSRMEITSSDAATADVQLSRVRVEIPDMGADVSHVLIQGEATDTTDDFLQYAEKSPVGGWVDHFTREVKATGTGRLTLALDIPLGDFDHAKVNGEYVFAGNTVALGPDIPRLDRAAGRLTFTEREFRARDVTGDALGGSATVQVSAADDKFRVSASGNADVAEVRKMYPFPFAEHLRGRTDWQFTLQGDGKNQAWTLESPLRGITSELPPPLAKRPDVALPLKVERQPVDRTHDRLTASIGTLATFDALRRVTDKGAEVQRLAFGLGRTKAVADRDGFWIRGSVDTLDLEPWLALASAQATPASSPTAAAAAAANKGGAAGGLELTGVDVHADTMLAFGRRFRNMHTQVRSQPAGWRIEIDSPDVAGSATWQPAQATRAGDTGKLTARLRRLGLPPEEPVPAGTPPSPARRELPALDIVADSYVSKGRDLGRLELAAKPEGVDWRIDTLALRNPESDLTATGRWRVQGNTQRTDVEVKLEVRDAGVFLARHGVPEGVKGGSGTLAGQFNWVGGPHDFDYPTLNGRFTIDIDRGQFTKVDPGIGKLLGVLNLSALARRLRFDFRDVTAEGYTFDEIGGDVTVRSGVMSTSNVRVTGPAAKVEIEGEADIARETQKLRIHVQPAMSGGLAAAAAAAVNPIIGAGVLLGSTILKDPMGRMFAGDYSVTGTWVNPKVEPIGRGSRGTPAASTGAAP